MQRQRSQASMRVARQIASLLWSHGRDKLLQSSPTLCDPIDGSPPGSPVPGILQARILEWIAISLFRGSSPPRDRIEVSYFSCIWSQIHLSITSLTGPGCTHWEHHKKSGLPAPYPTTSPLPLLPLSSRTHSLPTATCGLHSHTTPPRALDTFTDVTAFLESRTAAAPAHGHQPLAIGATVHARGAAGLPF